MKLLPPVLLATILCTNVIAQRHIASADTIKRPWLYFSATYGFCAPGGTYGSQTYNTYDYLYAGFANTGYCANISGEIRSKKGWALELQGNYYHNDADFSGILDENAQNPDVVLNGFRQYKTEFYDHGIINILATGGGTSYNSSSYLVCLAKHFYFDQSSASIHIGLGSLFFNVPSFSGTLTMSGHDTATKASVSRNFNLNVAPESSRNFLFDFGMGIEGHLYKGLYAKATLDFAVANIMVNGQIKINDTDGTTLMTGPLETPLTFLLVNFAAGLAYGF